MNTNQRDSSISGESWFYEKNGQRIGGVDESAIVSLIRSGQLGHGSIVWKQGFSDWMKLEDTPLRAHLDQLAPPPLKGDNLNNTLVWSLAFAPILGIFLEIVISMIVYDDEDWALDAVSAGEFFYITIALNILLSFIDEKRLKKAGHNTSALKGWVWLVPVYLYQRAKHLKQNLAYFIVWICCFIFTLLLMGADDEAYYEESDASYQNHSEQAPSRASNRNLNNYETFAELEDACVDDWIGTYRQEFGRQAMITNGQLQEWREWCEQGRWP